MPRCTDDDPAISLGPRKRSSEIYLFKDQIDDPLWPADSLDDCPVCGAKPGTECRTVFRRGIFHTPWTHRLLGARV